MSDFWHLACTGACTCPSSIPRLLEGGLWGEWEMWELAPPSPRIPCRDLCFGPFSQVPVSAASACMPAPACGTIHRCCACMRHSCTAAVPAFVAPVCCTCALQLSLQQLHLHAAPVTAAAPARCAASTAQPTAAGPLFSNALVFPRSTIYSPQFIYRESL